MLKQLFTYLIILCFPLLCFGQNQQLINAEKIADTIVFTTDTIYSVDSIFIEEYIDEYINEDEMFNPQNYIGFHFQQGSVPSRLLDNSNINFIVQPKKVIQTNMGIEYGKKLPNNFTLFSGLFFTQYKQQFYFNSNSLQKITYFNKTDTLDISYGDDINTVGFDSIVYVISEENKYSEVDSFPISNSYCNSLKYFEIPIGITFPLDLFSRYRVNLSGGVLVDIFQKSDELRLYQLNETYVSAFDNSEYKNVLFSFFGSIDYEWLLSENVSLTMGGKFSTQLGSLFKNNTGLKTRSNGYFINVGLKNYF